jgi:hypothetical protein
MMASNTKEMTYGFAMSSNSVFMDSPSAPVDPVIAPSDRDEAAVARDDGIDIELGFYRAVYLSAFEVPQFPAGGLVEVEHLRAAMVILRGAVGVEQIEQSTCDTALLHAGLGVI